MHINRGSCLTALSVALDSIRAYADSHFGKLPDEQDQGTTLRQVPLNDVNRRLIAYINKPGLTTSNSPTLIILTCNREDQDQMQYVGTLNGEVWLVPKDAAVLGKEIPPTRSKRVLPPSK